ncbi:MAG: hypothetical protein M3O73_04190 [Actinomycetota bacterium]|nr:hypothetical protein [Actinomycetota bacterium]
MRLVPWIPPLLRDRAAGGRALSEAVATLQLDEPVVIGVARGGVAVAGEVARELEAPLTAIDVERVNAYGLRLGAVTADGPPYLREGHGVPEADVESALKRARRQPLPWFAPDPCWV